MLCRMSLSAVRLYSRGSAFKPVSFNHKITGSDLNIIADDTPRTKTKNYKSRHFVGRAQTEEVSGETPVIKAPFPRSQSVGNRFTAPPKKRNYKFDFGYPTEGMGVSDDNYSRSQILSDNDTKDDSVPRDVRHDIEDEDIYFQTSHAVRNVSFASQKDRRHTKRSDTHWPSTRNISSKKKTHWKPNENDRRTLDEINSDALEIEESILREYGEKEHLYGIHPVLLALKAGKREIHRVYCKEGLQNSNPLVAEVYKLCMQKGIEFCSIHGKVFKRVFDSGTVHQGVMCYAGYLPVDVFHIEELDDVQRETPQLLPDSSTLNRCENNEVQITEDFGRHKLTAADASRVTCEEKSLQTEVTIDKRKRLWVVLDRVVDPMNVGAVLRSCSYFGVSRVFMTPSSGELSPVVSKASSGAAELLRLSLLPRPSEQLEQLRARGWQVVVAAPQVVSAASTSQAVPVTPQREEDPKNGCHKTGTQVLESSLEQLALHGAGDPSEGSPLLPDEGQALPLGGDQAPSLGGDQVLSPGGGQASPPGGEDTPPDLWAGKRSMPVQDFVFDRDTILVVGNEGSGVSAGVAAAADTVVTVSAARPDGLTGHDGLHLPCLNVSAATAVILHAVTAARSRV